MSRMTLGIQFILTLMSCAVQGQATCPRLVLDGQHAGMIDFLKNCGVATTLTREADICSFGTLRIRVERSEATSNYKRVYPGARPYDPNAQYGPPIPVVVAKSLKIQLSYELENGRADRYLLDETIERRESTIESPYPYGMPHSRSIGWGRTIESDYYPFLTTMIAGVPGSNLYAGLKHYLLVDASSQEAHALNDHLRPSGKEFNQMLRTAIDSLLITWDTIPGYIRAGSTHTQQLERLVSYAAPRLSTEDGGLYIQGLAERPFFLTDPIQRRLYFDALCGTVFSPVPSASPDQTLVMFADSSTITIANYLSERGTKPLADTSGNAKEGSLDAAIDAVIAQRLMYMEAVTTKLMLDDRVREAFCSQLLDHWKGPGMPLLRPGTIPRMPRMQASSARVPTAEEQKALLLAHVEGVQYDFLAHTCEQANASVEYDDPEVDTYLARNAAKYKTEKKRFRHLEAWKDLRAAKREHWLAELRAKYRPVIVQEARSQLLR